MDVIVSVCRALAYQPRLRLLRGIYARPGATVQSLATALGLSVDTASRQIKLLRNFHLIQTTPRGRYVTCEPGRLENTGNPFLQDLQRLLRPIMEAKDQNRTLAQVCDSQQAVSWPMVEDEMEKIFTTYTHLRRLLILRQLIQRGVSTSAELADSVGMSADATRRQLDKLQRRKVVMAAGLDSQQWCLQPLLGTTFRAQLLKLVVQSIKRRTA